MKNCILVYKNTHYYKGYNSYLGCADITESLGDAKKMTFDEADKSFSRMHEKDDWQIWSYESRERYLGKEANRKILEEIEAKEKEIEELKKQLRK